MALGNQGSGLISNSQEMAIYVLKVAKSVGEPIWQLPLWPELAREIKSEIADLKNIANPNIKAGSLVAGAFLKEFVGQSNWVHLDIAGTGWDCKATGFPSTGGSGFGVRTLAAACLSFEEEEGYR